MSVLAAFCLLVWAVAPVASSDGMDQAGLRRRIQLLEKAGNYAGTLPLYQRLHELSPQDSLVVHGLSQALESAGQYRRLADLLEPWLREHPADLQAGLSLGDAYHRLGMDDRAAEVWKGLLQSLPPTPQLFLQVSDWCRAAGLHDTAIQILLEGRKRLGRKDLFDWDLAHLYLRREEGERAVDAFLRSLRRHPNRLPLVERRLTRSMKDPAVGHRILKELEAALHSAPDRLTAAWLASACTLELGDPSKGLRILESIEDASEKADLLFQFASRCQEKGYARTAARAYALFAEQKSDSPYLFQALLRQADLAAEMGAYDQAARLYRRLVQKYPDRPEVREALFRLGQLQQERLGDPESACASFQAILRSSRQDEWSCRALERAAECALRKGDFEKADELLDKLSFWDPGSEYLARFRQAELAYFQLDFEKARKTLEQLLEKDPGNDLANEAIGLLLRCEELQDQSPGLEHFVRAHLLERQSRPAEAEKEWKKLAKTASPDLCASNLLIRARVRESQGKRKDALALYERLIDLYPQSRYAVEAQAEAARLYEELGAPDQALRLCETAVLSAPDDARAPQLRLRIQRLRRLTGKEER